MASSSRVTGAPSGVVPPERVVHADWGTARSKRWAAEARLVAGEYRVSAPRVVIDPVRDARHVGRSALLGFDSPIGIPLAYAQQIGCGHFLDLLAQLGHDEWQRFF